METDFQQWLEAVVRRNRVRVGTQLLLLSVAAAAGIWAVFSAQILSTWAAGALSVVGLVLAAVSAFAIWTRRDGAGCTLSSAARHYDERLGLQHRLTSALEQKRSGLPDGLLSAALLADANRHVAGIDPARMAPLADRQTLGAALGVGLLAASLILWPAPPAMEPADVGTTTDEQTPVPAATIEDIEAAARQIAVDASMRDVDELAAAATGLNALLRQAAQGLPQDQINQRFAELIDLARMGYGDNLPSWIAENPSPSESLAGLIQDFQERQRQQSRPSTLPPSPSSGEGSANNSSEVEGAGSLGVADDAVETAPLAGLSAPGLPAGKEDELPSASRGAPVGASTQSGTGGGDMAGSGSQPLQAAPLVGERRDGSEMRLEAAELEGTGRIRIDMTLAPSSTEGLQAEAGDERLDGTLLPTVLQLDRAFVQMGDRAAPARYFAPVEPDKDPLRP